MGNNTIFPAQHSAGLANILEPIGQPAITKARPVQAIDDGLAAPHPLPGPAAAKVLDHHQHDVTATDPEVLSKPLDLLSSGKSADCCALGAIVQNGVGVVD